jgi:two-component sensor histidine kinase
VVRRGELVGVFFAHCADPRDWSENDIDLVRAIADRTHAAVARLQAEEEQRLLNQELSHRLKNTLALVQAIATQTLKAAGDRPAVENFRQRLMTLSRAHDVLLQRSWLGARIRAVVDTVMSTHVGVHRLTVEGPDINLGPKAVLSLSMLLHELATNAVKHGAWSQGGGDVALSWSIDHAGARPTLVLIWAERGGPPATAPAVQGLGSRLIRLGLSGTGNAVVSYSAPGLRAEFSAPLALVAEN